MIRIMMISCFLLVLFISANAQNTETVDLRSETALEVTTNKILYNVKEPVKLTISFKNSSNKTFTGTFAITSLAPNVKIYYRNINSSFEVYNFTHVHGLYGPSEILPNEESVLSVPTLLYDTKQKKFAFDEPGEYELKVIYKSIEVDNYPFLESNTTRIQILKPEQEELAVKFYSDELLARLIQGEGFFDVGTEAYKSAIDKAISLAQKYPNSFYTAVLRNSQLKTLHTRIKDSSIGVSEQILYNILKEQDNEGLLEEKQNGTSQELDQRAIDFFIKNAKSKKTEKDKD